MIDIKDIPSLVRSQKEFFRTGTTLDVKWRREQLKALLAAVKKYEKPLYDALWQDLHKSGAEAFLCEISIVTGEIREALKKLGRWTRPRRASTPFTHFPARSRIVSEPLGNSLIIAPWNYPVNLLLCPLVGAISSGCTAVLKPSPYVPHVSGVLEELIQNTFPKEYIAIVRGHRDVNAALLEQRWDIIFFTGSPALGRTVMASAAKNLTPVVLELGGKSPCVVDRDADIALAAKRIAWGKTLNAGQTCIAPDYLLVHEVVAERFTEAFRNALEELHGTDAKASEHFVRMVSDRAFSRVKGYLSEGRILVGGGFDEGERYMEPTLLADVDPGSPVMTEEIFGPVLPMLKFRDIGEVVEFVNSREKPLAFYYFGKPWVGRELIHRTSGGGACINDVIMHFANTRLPFGGVGNSGMGCYHGIKTFDAFSHRRSVLTSSTLVDLPFRYMPYKGINLLKKILK